ncbi:MAG: HAD-IA family hydrolase [Proteobacteria bacterium]|nr:HAD-IA family hydrolase [Pseudomonadota bacterium]
MKSIIFDLDGTLFDSKNGIINAFIYPLEEMGIEYDKTWVERMIGHTLKDMYSEILPVELKDKTDWCIEEYRKIYVEQFYYGSCLYEGVEVTLKELKKSGALLAIATTKPTGITEKIAGHFHIVHYFNVIMGTEDNTPYKPDPAIIYNIKKIIDFDDEHTIFVGDTYLDIIAGKNAGIKTCAAMYGYGDRLKLFEGNPDYSIRTIYDVINILEVL